MTKMAKRGRPRIATHECSAAFRSRKPRTSNIKIRGQTVKITRFYPDNQRKDWLCAISYVEGKGFLTCQQCKRRGLCQRNNLMYQMDRGGEGNGTTTGLQSSGNGMAGEHSGGLSRYDFINIYKRSHPSKKDGDGAKSTAQIGPMDADGDICDSESNARSVCTNYNSQTDSGSKSHSVLSGELYNIQFAPTTEIEVAGAPEGHSPLELSRSGINLDIHRNRNPPLGAASRIRTRTKTIRNDRSRTVRCKRSFRFNKGQRSKAKRIAPRGHSSRNSPELHKWPQTRYNFRGRKTHGVNITGKCAHLSQGQRDKTLQAGSDKVNGAHSRQKIGHPEYNSRYAEDVRATPSSTRRFDPDHNVAPRSQKRGNNDSLSGFGSRRDEDSPKNDKSNILHHRLPSQRSVEHKEPFGTSDILDAPSKVQINEYYESLAARLRDMDPDSREKAVGQIYVHNLQRMLTPDFIRDHLHSKIEEALNFDL